MSPDRPKIRFNYKVWLETEDGEGIFGYGQMRLLKAIEESGTLKSASDETGFNYKKSLAKLKEIENILGYRIVKQQRDNGRRFTGLTEEGKLLIQFIEDFNKTYEKLINKACEEASDKLNSGLRSCKSNIDK